MVNQLTFIESGRRGKQGSHYNWYRCACGVVKEILQASVRSGRTKSCGCLNRSIVSMLRTTHGLSESREYGQLENIKDRCLNPNNPRFADYGGRGIKLFADWYQSPKLFIDYVRALPNANTPNYTLDRIDNDGDYMPGNLQWATKREQVLNRRCKKVSVSITF